MIKRTGVVLSWLAAGHAVWGGLYWALLQVPESNVLMLGASLLLALALVWWLGTVEAVGLLASAPGGTVRGSLAPAAKRGWLVIAPLLVFCVVWLLTAHASTWLSVHGSQIDAWLILKTGWTKGQYVERGLIHLVAFVRWGVGLSLAAALFAAVLRGSVSALRSTAWLKASLHWRALLVFAGALGLAVLLPSHLIDWRWVPKDQAGTWFEPAFATVKLGVIYLWGNLVWALVLRFVAGRAAATGQH